MAFVQHIESITRVVIPRLVPIAPNAKVDHEKATTKRLSRNPKSPNPHKPTMLRPKMEDFLNMSYPIALLACPLNMEAIKRDYTDLFWS